MSEGPGTRAFRRRRLRQYRRRQPSPTSRQSWLRENRLKVALGIAVAEVLFVSLEEDFSRITVIVIAIPVVLFWLLAGRTLDSELGREISWILAMSQALAVVAAIVAILIPTVALVLAGISAPSPRTCSTTTGRTGPSGLANPSGRRVDARREIVSCLWWGVAKW